MRTPFFVTHTCIFFHHKKRWKRCRLAVGGREHRETLLEIAREVPRARELVRELRAPKGPDRPALTMAVGTDLEYMPSGNFE